MIRMKRICGIIGGRKVVALWWVGNVLDHREIELRFEVTVAHQATGRVHLDGEPRHLVVTWQPVIIV